MRRHRKEETREEAEKGNRGSVRGSPVMEQGSQDKGADAGTTPPRGGGVFF